MVGVGAVATQLIVVSLTGSKLAESAGSMVISLDVVIVLAQLSVNVHVSVYEPPQLLWDPVMVEVTDPLISQLPD